MLYFESDYTEGACPEILNNLVKSNLESLSGYGNDKYCLSAEKKIKLALKSEEVSVRFLVGGTQTNQVVIDSVLNDYEGVVAVKSGHISIHEAGAIEFTGHKVIALDGKDGKLDSDVLNGYISDFYSDLNNEHMVHPGMVYISQPTEYGTIYSKAELENIYSVCKKFDIPLYIDGARLGYALVCDESDLELSDLVELCDIFYIGGTKVGALCGEAVVFTHNNEPKHFTTIIKQHGALLAKGRLLGIQFDTLFTNDLYFRLSRNAIDTADRLKKAFSEKGYKFYIDSPTNQIFIVLENSKMDELSKKVSFSFWEKFDESHTVVRFATSWSTTLKSVEELIKLL